jgi:hypothetical protein
MVMRKDIWCYAGYAWNMVISMAKTIQEERLRWINPRQESYSIILVM